MGTNSATHSWGSSLTFQCRTSLSERSGCNTGARWHITNLTARYRFCHLAPGASAYYLCACTWTGAYLACLALQTTTVELADHPQHDYCILAARLWYSVLPAWSSAD